jgi:hypothetical protein
MATIAPLTLKVSLGGSRKVIVDYTINWSGLDKLGNVGYWEQVTLWGDDPKWDNRIKVLGNFEAYANGQDSLTRSREFTVSRKELDEDPFPGDDDEVYVKVILQDKEGQMLPVPRNSNTVVIGN